MHPDIKDEDLLVQLKNDREEALALLYNRYRQFLYYKAMALLKDQHACEDIVQELFVRIWKGRHQLKITTSFQAYLLASVRYEVLRKIKSGKVHAASFADLEQNYRVASGNYPIEQKELAERVNLVVSRLSAKCRQVYLLSREEQLSHKEIASLMEISTKTVENHLTKALRELKLSLGFTVLLLLVQIV